MSVLSNFINKSDVLEKGIRVFPSLSIEGAAASGKSVAVEMLIQNHPKQRVEVFWVEEEIRHLELFLERLAKVQVEMKEETLWVVFEECPAHFPREIEELIYQMIQEISNDSKVILVGREVLPERFLNLLWKGKLERISQEQLNFTRQEVRQLTEEWKSALDPMELYEITGGWPGCVMLMLRMAEQSDRNVSVQKLRASYEVETYLQQQIIRRISAEEMQVFQLARSCPWINVELCQEIGGISNAEYLLEKLQRKGLLICRNQKENWRLAPLFAYSRGISAGKESVQWYAKRGYFKEMFVCLEQIKEEAFWKKMLQEHFSKVPFLEDFFSILSEKMDILEWTENTPEFCYLRGMYCIYQEDLKGYDREVLKLEQCKNYTRFAEIYLNLRFVDVRISTDDWLELVECYWKEQKSGEKLSLYGRKDQWFTCLSGMRDLSDLFACSKKEESRKARLWRAYLGENEWNMYQVARVEYHMETDQREQIPQEDQQLFRKVLRRGEDFSFPVYFVLCHLHKEEYDDELILRMKYLEERLISEDSYCRKNAETVVELQRLLLEEKGELFHWSQERERILETEITKDNVIFYYCRAKGYIYLEQYERAQKILQKVVLYLKKRRNIRFLSEVLFEQAIVFYESGQSGKALQSVIESFLVNGTRHYVGFYTEYGQRGRKVLELYVDWLKRSSPEGWQRKKKYKYGNVVRMPQNDYVEYLLRKAKHSKNHSIEQAQHQKAESLTMMERIVLQSISMGMSNAEICDELNLKLSTVKSHIYNLYKKLGVKNRTQAILRWKEMEMMKK